MIEVVSVSRAEDASYHATADVAGVAAQIGADYRLVGGHMVSLLAAWAGVDDVPGRETADADLGASFAVIANPALTSALRALSYSQPGASNRFVRDLGDGLEAVIDVLGPSYTSHHQPNQRHGELIVDAIPGLAYALAAPAQPIQFTATLTGGGTLAANVTVPAPLPALCLKLLAWQSRFAGKDLHDIWRLLAVAHKTGVTGSDWTGGTPQQARRILADLAALGNKPLAYHFPDRRQRSRIRALAQAVAGLPDAPVAPWPATGLDLSI